MTELEQIKQQLFETVKECSKYKLLADGRANDIEDLQLRCVRAEHEVTLLRKQLSEYALIVGAARKVASGFGSVTTPDEDQLFDLIEKYFLQVK